MSRRQILDAVVVGAGPVGAALALALARDGFEVALVEARAPKPWRAEDEVDPRVVALAPDARDLLDDLDVWTSIAERRAGAYRHMRVWDALAPGELHFDAAERGAAALGWIVENRLIQDALWRACAAGASAVALDREDRAATYSGRIFESRRAAGDVRVHCPAEVVEIENGDEAVVATLDDGTRLRAALLVAAEGAESSLRGRLGIAFGGRDYGQRAVVAHVATERPHESTAWQRFQPGGPLAFLPLADGRCSIVWSLPDAEAARVLALDDAAFRAELGCAFDFRLGAITAATPRLAFPLRLRLAERYVDGRCALVGDAAHVVHPLAGQGMNLGFRDVACLRRVLREARERGDDHGAAPILRRYERERRSENTLAARGLDAIERVFGTDIGPVAALRGAALAAVDRFGPIKHWFANRAAGR
ncbi:UbiH/UbiF/VisC/COQ6 family ubiquinone biosynthesis hydroxylase [Dokdonella sp.]|uniref:UbiH/UbiF/VisC/COQ6 family ubiquinone biosynthesis hydroxylase n=1 Tax=Dokdonella sp. TaxID=2291710 RepID=UPI001B055164|nr:UbiH/UbiF/VisC/COQ6 family ubiquinone biosynthesis hydroxylase [Dokdonella sp.]MBO9663813.1 UbiH/UbiF/VisC/COQ6 family ubiquinone biosynthesis hydroxylase [Dokdonella sp.]